MVEDTNNFFFKLIILLSIFLFVPNLFFVFKVYGQSDGVTGSVKITVCGNNVKEPLEQCDGTDLVGKACSSLGFDGGTLACLPSCQFDTTNCGSASPDFNEVVIAQGVGGSLELENPEKTGALIEVPANAFQEDLSLFAYSHLNSSDIVSGKTVPSGKSFVGNVYNFLFFDESGNRVYTLLDSADIAVTYDNDDFSGLDESEIEPYHWNETDLTWHLIPGSDLDEEENTITFSSTSFSLFALFSIPPSSSSSTSSSSSSGSNGGGYFNGLFSLPFSTPSIPISNVDFSGDGRVDITDFSVMLYYWNKTGPEAAPYDLNKDGVIDIVDASILFYYWSE